MIDDAYALLDVVKSGDEEAASRLLAMHPALVHQAAPDCDWTVFHFAAFNGCDTLVSRLLLSIASQPEREELLLRRSTQWNEGARPGSTALHVAALKSRSNIVAQLLAACPASIDVLDDDKQTCLHSAAHVSDKSTMETLLAFKPALAHAIDAQGNTILHLMLHWAKRHFVSIEVLQRVWKMNPSALRTATFLGDTPFDLAVAARNDMHTSAIDLLQWSLTFDEIVSAYDKRKMSYVVRFKPLIELQCEELANVLLSDVLHIVFEYVGLLGNKQ